MTDRVADQPGDGAPAGGEQPGAGPRKWTARDVSELAVWLMLPIAVCLVGGLSLLALLYLI